MTADLDDLALFSRVVELGSFAALARELGVPTSTVSRAVARLEAEMQVRLLHRTTRTLRTTTEGAALFARVQPALTTLRTALRDAATSESEPRGPLRITAPTDLGATLVADVLCEFCAAFPGVSVEVSLTQRVVDLVREGFDLALRAGPLRDSSLVARRVGTLTAQLFASPRYVERRGTPRSLAELREHELVLFRGQSGIANWKLGRGARESVSFEAHGRIAGDDFLFVREAVIAGAGIGLMPRLICARAIEEGDLLQVLEPWAAQGSSLAVVYPSSRHVPAKVTAFRDFVLRQFPQTARESPRRTKARR
jgi:DNA-binding transcriptional LysR family regulator